MECVDRSSSLVITQVPSIISLLPWAHVAPLDFTHFSLYCISTPARRTESSIFVHRVSRAEGAACGRRDSSALLTSSVVRRDVVICRQVRQRRLLFVLFIPI